jgi:hypothetical protein
MLSKEAFRYLLVFIGVWSFISGTFGYFTGQCIEVKLECINVVLVCVSIGLFAAVIISKFASPRRGRYTLLFFGIFGCVLIDVILFVRRYYICNGTFSCFSGHRNNVSEVLAAFFHIYGFCAVMLLYLGGLYTLSFKQHVAWNTLFLLQVHYNVFAVIKTYVFDSVVSSVNLIGCLSLTALVVATELLNRFGTKKAQASVSKDSEKSQERWKNLMIDGNNTNFKKQIEELKKTAQGGSLKAVCEPLDPKTKKFIPRIVLQTHADIDRLYRDCSVLNYFFQDWVRTWFQSGTNSDEFECCNPEAPYKKAFKIHVANCFPDVVRGPIKSPNRVISKVVFISTIPIS